MMNYLNIKLNLEKICYISFSNAAAKEARERIEKEYPKFSFEWMCAQCILWELKELGINTTTQLLKGKNWNGFKNYSHSWSKI